MRLALRINQDFLKRPFLSLEAAVPAVLWSRSCGQKTPASSFKAQGEHETASTATESSWLFRLIEIASGQKQKTATNYANKQRLKVSVLIFPHHKKHIHHVTVKITCSVLNWVETLHDFGQ